MSALNNDMTYAVAASEIHRSYHPSYRDEDASLVLSSSDGHLFRVHPIILQLASEIFKNMLSNAQDTDEPIQLDEKSDILLAMLDLIYPNGDDRRIASGQTFEFIWNLLNAAEKYGIRKIIKMFRTRLLTDPYFTTRPVESYVIACRFSWVEEIVIVAVLCIDYVNEPASTKLLGLLDTSHALRLHKLIFTRNTKLQKTWGSIAFDESTWADSETRRNHDSYKAILLSLVQQELARSPSGKSVKAEFWDRSEVKVLISSPCQIENAKIKVAAILNALPTAVEDPDAQHSLLTTKIITDKIFQRHQGFDLANLDGPLSDSPSFQLLKTTPYHIFKTRVAAYFNFNTSQFRLWYLINRQNKTVRPETHIPENDSTLTIETIRNDLAYRYSTLQLYLEVISDPNPTPGSVMIFLKHFNAPKQTLFGVGKIHVRRDTKIGDLNALVNERMRWPAGTPIDLYEEIKAGMIELLKPDLTFGKRNYKTVTLFVFRPS